MKTLIMFAFVFVASIGYTSGLSCYTCSSNNSPLTCSKNVFIPTDQHVSGCTCCRKHVSSDGTERTCEGALTALNCIQTDSNFVCMSDLCNGGQSLNPSVSRASLVSVVFAATVAGFVWGRRV